MAAHCRLCLHCEEKSLMFQLKHFKHDYNKIALLHTPLAVLFLAFPCFNNILSSPPKISHCPPQPKVQCISPGEKERVWGFIGCGSDERIL